MFMKMSIFCAKIPSGVQMIIQKKWTDYLKASVSIVFFTLFVVALTSCFNSKKETLMFHVKLYDHYLKSVEALGYSIPQDDYSLYTRFSDAVSTKDKSFTTTHLDNVILRQTLLKTIVSFEQTYNKYRYIYTQLEGQNYLSYSFESTTPYFIYPLKLSLLTKPLLEPYRQRLRDSLLNFNLEATPYVPLLDKSAQYYLSTIIKHETYDYSKWTNAFFKSCNQFPFDFNIRNHLEELYHIETVFNLDVSNRHLFSGYCSFDHLYYTITLPKRLYLQNKSANQNERDRLNETLIYLAAQLAKLPPMTSPINGIIIKLDHVISPVRQPKTTNPVFNQFTRLATQLSSKEHETLSLFYIKNNNHRFNMPVSISINGNSMDMNELIK